jgi:hypothetical protein
MFAMTSAVNAAGVSIYYPKPYKVFKDTEHIFVSGKTKPYSSIYCKFGYFDSYHIFISEHSNSTPKKSNYKGLFYCYHSPSETESGYWHDTASDSHYGDSFTHAVFVHAIYYSSKYKVYTYSGSVYDIAIHSTQDTSTAPQ